MDLLRVLTYWMPDVVRGVMLAPLRSWVSLSEHLTHLSS